MTYWNVPKTTKKGLQSGSRDKMKLIKRLGRTKHVKLKKNTGIKITFI
jgi:hypothetical protein